MNRTPRCNTCIGAIHLYALPFHSPLHSPLTMDKSDSDKGNAVHYVLLFGIIYTLLVALYFTQRRLSRLCCKRKHPADESLDSDTRTTCCYERSSRKHNEDINITCDERDYHSWSVDEVAHWTYCKLATIDSGGYHVHNLPLYSCHGSSISRGLQKTVRAIHKQCIDGASLEHLSLQHLLSFDIPFGMAVHLNNYIQDLISGNLSSNGMNAAAHNKHRLRSDLIQLPSWYEQENQTVSHNNSSSNDEEMGTEMQENVQQIMQDRFGMTLPSLRKSDNIQNQNNIMSPDIEPIGRMEPKELAQIMQMKPIEQSEKPPQRGASSSSNNNLDDVLKNMPPHVRAIAERRPDLVSRLISEMQQQSQNEAHASLHPISEEQQDAFEESEEEVSYDSEYVGLLRRRTNNNNR